MRPNALVSLGVATTGIGIGLTHFEPPAAVGALLGQVGQTLLGHGLLAFGVTVLVPLLAVAAIWQTIAAPARQAEGVPNRDAVMRARWVFVGSVLVGLLYLIGWFAFQWLRTDMPDPSVDPTAHERSGLLGAFMGVLVATSLARWQAQRRLGAAS
jgi:hypothetical protein